MKEKINLKISGKISYAAEIDEATAARIITICAQGTINAGGKANFTGNFDAPVNEPAGSIGEYLDRFNPKRNPDKILAIAAYLKEGRGRAFFKPTDIKPYFAKAGEPIPGNFNRDFHWVKSAKWIAESEEQRGAYYVTSKGLRVVHEGFSGELVKESRGKANRFGRRRVPKKK